MLESLGVSYDRRNGGYGDLGGQLQDGLVDVLAFSAGVPIPVFSQLEAQTDLLILQFTETEQSSLVEGFPVARATIPAAAYTSLDQDALAVSMWNFAIAGKDVPEDLVYEVVKIVMENHEAMLQVQGSAAATLPENFIHNTVLPWHPGAVRWFEENGYEVPDDLKG